MSGNSQHARSLRHRAIGVAVALATLGAVALTVDLDALRGTLAQASAGALALAALAYLPPWLLRGWRWQLLARDLGDEVPLGPATATATVGNMLNLLLPAKAGDLLWANAAHVRWGVPYGRAVVGVLAGRVLDLVVLTGLGALALVALPAGWARYGGALAVSALIGLLALGLGGVAALRWRLGRRALVGPLARLRGLHDALVEPLDALTRSPGAALRHGGITALIWANEAVVAWMVAGALGVELPLSGVLFGIMVANLSKILPLTPAAMGTYEAAGAMAMSVAGPAYSAAFAVALVEHLLKNGVNLALGLLAMALTDVPVLDVDRARLAEAWRAQLTPPELSPDARSDAAAP
ncbi:MAG: flippase-like domain-containing protein [Alphaproteobacteria bacterium]|nr:flippase-like domain-containing protein [Alphaproteobacteria bacterium]